MNGGKHCYPGSEVLINKYNIYDKQLLEKLEIQKVTVKLLGLDINPDRIEYTYDVEHLVNVHKYLFGDIYDWAGTFREENLYKSERVLSGGSAEYADYHDIGRLLEEELDRYSTFDWKKASDIGSAVSDFLLELWSIHPFREGNTRTCITFLWHYLYGKGTNFQVELLQNNPMYVRDSLVMANYDQKEYLIRIISDALSDGTEKKEYMQYKDDLKEKYHISKDDYESFREKYSIKRNYTER